MDLYSSSEITVHQLNELKQDDKKIQIIDVREDTERDHAHIKGTIHMKLSEIAKRYTELDKKKNIFVMCHTGTRSQAVCKWLKAQGYNHCITLTKNIIILNRISIKRLNLIRFFIISLYRGLLIDREINSIPIIITNQCIKLKNT